MLISSNETKNKYMFWKTLLERVILRHNRLQLPYLYWKHLNKTIRTVRQMVASGRKEKNKTLVEIPFSSI